MTENQTDDVERRTSLANERTRLAWWRTGLASFAVAVGIGRLLPALTPDATAWPAIVVGLAFAVYGIAFFVHGSRRSRRVDDAIGLDSTQRDQHRSLALLSAAGVLLGVATIVLIVIQ